MERVKIIKKICPNIVNGTILGTPKGAKLGTVWNINTAVLFQMCFVHTYLQTHSLHGAEHYLKS
jgi:hypothetical protein